MHTTSKKVLSLFLALCLLFSTAALLGSCGSLSFESITVDRTSITGEYTVGDEPDLSGIVINVRYNDRAQNVTLGLSDVKMTIKDETGAEIALADLTKTAGEKTVTVSYDDKAISGETRTTSFTVTVHESTKPAFASMELNTKNAKLAYATNETVDFSDVTCTLHYNNADDVILGKNKLTFTAKDETGADVALDDLTKTAGTKTVTVTATDVLTDSGKHSESFTVTVAVAFVSITLVEDSAPMLYVGETYDLSALSFLIRYSSPECNKTVAFSDVAISLDGKPIAEVDLTETLGTKELAVSYVDGEETRTGSFILSVVNPGFIGITLDIENVKKDYYITDNADFSGISVAADYADDALDASYAYGDAAIAVTGFDSSSAGEKVITVTFTDEWGNTASKTFTVNVKAPSLIEAKLAGGEASVPKGKTPDLTDLKLTLTYDPEAYSTVLEAKDLQVGTIDTSSAGTKNIEISYTDPYTKATKAVNLMLVVTDGKILELSASKSVTTAKANREKAGSAQSGEAGFEDQFFANGDTTYYAGNANPFIYAPSFKLVDDDLEDMTVPYLQTVITAKIGDTALTAKGNNYYLGEDLIFSYNVQKTAFTFTNAALNKDVTISIDASRQHYEVADSVKPTVITVHVIDAYNIYTAKDLCVIDNSQPDLWTTFKEEYGYADITVNGVVLQADINLTEKDVPDAFFYTSIAEITTTAATIRAGSKFLKDGSEIYRRYMNNGETFRIEGNYYTLSVQSFPLVAATGDEAAFAEGSDATYGSDCSNASLFRVKPNDASTPINAAFNFNNINFIGNANRDEVKNESGSLVSRGGLILQKVTAVTSNNTNVLARCFFISFFPEDGGSSHNNALLQKGTDYSVMNLDRVKCFDSNQNAGFVWGSATLNVKDSYLQRAGGPLVILQHVSPNDKNNDGQQYRIPKFTATGSVLESYVTGQEAWFESVGAATLAGSIMNMSNLLSRDGVGSYVTGNKMNLIALSMSDGSDASVMFNTNTQAYISVDDGFVFSRMTTDPLGATVHGWQEGISQMAGGDTIPVFSAATNTTDGFGLIWTDTNYLFTELGITPMSSIPANFTTTDYIGLNFGGFGLVIAFTPAGN